MDHVEAQQTIVAELLNEARSGKTDFIKHLTDEVGLRADEFSNAHLAIAYKAARDVLIESALKGKPYQYADILGRIEVAYRTNGRADKAGALMEQWRSEIWRRNSGDGRESARLLKNHRLRTEFEAACDKWKSAVHHADAPAKDITTAAYQFLGLVRESGAGVPSLKSSMDEALEYVPVSSGIKWLDDNILYNRFAGFGGWTPTHMVLYVAPSENGKTSAATTFVVNWIKQRLPAVILSAEESRPNMTVRVLNALTGIPADEVLNLYRELNDGATELTNAHRQIREALAFMEEYLFIYEISGDMAEINAIARRHRLQFGVDTPLLLLVDHIGAMDTGSGNWSRDLEQVARGFKQLAQQTKSTVILFSQATAEMEKEFRTNNFTTEKEARGSRGIRMWADVIVAACRHNGTPPEGFASQRFRAATVWQSVKNRFRDDSTARYGWGVHEFDTVRGIISDKLVTDDFAAQLRMVK